jgi:hypothetical protein
MDQKGAVKAFFDKVVYYPLRSVLQKPH